MVECSTGMVDLGLVGGSEGVVSESRRLGSLLLDEMVRRSGYVRWRRTDLAVKDAEHRGELRRPSGDLVVNEGRLVGPTVGQLRDPLQGVLQRCPRRARRSWRAIDLRSGWRGHRSGGPRFVVLSGTSRSGRHACDEERHHCELHVRSHPPSGASLTRCSRSTVPQVVPPIRSTVVNSRGDAGCITAIPTLMSREGVDLRAGVDPADPMLRQVDDDAGTFGGVEDVEALGQCHLPRMTGVEVAAFG